MVKVNEHLDGAKKFCEIGIEEYEDGRKSGNILKMREGCEKVFHAYVEASTALIQKRELPEPEDHGERVEALYKLGDRKMIEVGKDAFYFLHRLAYYGYKILPDVDKTLKDVEEIIKYVQKRIRC